MKALLAMLLASACLAGCGGGSSSINDGPAPAPAQPTGINFTTFTEKLLQIQSDSAQPTAVTAGEFEFPDNDNPQAFAAVLPAA